jgi:hypothetical protein
MKGRVNLDGPMIPVRRKNANTNWWNLPADFFHLSNRGISCRACEMNSSILNQF